MGESPLPQNVFTIIKVSNSNRLWKTDLVYRLFRNCMQKLWRLNSCDENMQENMHNIMLKEWINKRLTRRIEIKAKLNIVDERLNFLLLKTKIVYLLLYLRMSPSKNHNIALKFSLWNHLRWRSSAHGKIIPSRYLIIHYVIRYLEGIILPWYLIIHYVIFKM